MEKIDDILIETSYIHAKNKIWPQGYFTVRLRDLRKNVWGVFLYEMLSH